MVADINTVKNNLQAKGLTATNTLVKLDADGAHNENYWKREFSAAYKWLFLTTPLKTVEVSKNKIIINIDKNKIFIKGLPKNSEGNIIDMSGKLIEKIQLKNGWNTLGQILPHGNYLLKTENDSVRFIAK